MDVAVSISEGFARNCVAVDLDGQLVDLTRPIETDANVRLITTRDPEALEIMRHTAAHVMAQAVMRLYPNAKLTIGPVVEDGFYYDGSALRRGLCRYRNRDEKDRQSQAAR